LQVQDGAITGQEFSDRRDVPVLTLIVKDDIVQYLGSQAADYE
jgi:hypothetical protein